MDDQKSFDFALGRYDLIIKYIDMADDNAETRVSVAPEYCRDPEYAFFMETLMDTLVQYECPDPEAVCAAYLKYEQEYRLKPALDNRKTILRNLCREYGVGCVMKKCRFNRWYTGCPYCGQYGHIDIYVVAVIEGMEITYSYDAYWDSVGSGDCRASIEIKVINAKTYETLIEVESQDYSADHEENEIVFRASVLFGEDTVIPEFIAMVNELVRKFTDDD